MSVEQSTNGQVGKSYGNATQRYVTLIEEVLLLATQYSYHFNQNLQANDLLVQKLFVALLMDVVNLVHSHIGSFQQTFAQQRLEQSSLLPKNIEINQQKTSDEGNVKQDLSSSFENILKRYHQLLDLKNLDKDKESDSKDSVSLQQPKTEVSGKVPAISIPLLDLDDIKDGKTDEQINPTSNINSFNSVLLPTNLSSSDTTPVSLNPKDLLLPVITISSPLASPTANRRLTTPQTGSTPLTAPPHYPMYPPPYYSHPYGYLPYYYPPYMPPFSHSALPEHTPQVQPAIAPTPQIAPVPPQLAQPAQVPATSTPSTQPPAENNNNNQLNNTNQPPAIPVPAAPPKAESAPRTTSPTPVQTSPRSRSTSVPNTSSPRTSPRKPPTSPRSHLAPTDPSWSSASSVGIPPHSPIAKIPSSNATPFTKPAALMRAPTITDFQELPQPQSKSAPTSQRSSPTPIEPPKESAQNNANNNNNNNETEEEFVGLIHSSPASFFRNLQKQATAPPGRAMVIQKSAPPGTTVPIRNRPAVPPSKLSQRETGPGSVPSSPETRRMIPPKMTRKPVNKVLQKVSQSPAESSEEDSEDSDHSKGKRTQSPRSDGPDFMERHQSVFDFFLNEKKEEGAGWWLKDMPDDVEVWEYDGQGNSIRGPRNLRPTESVMEFFQKYENEIPRSSTPSPRG